jgi:DNA-binding PadR family transcriptional regulator
MAAFALGGRVRFFEAGELRLAVLSLLAEKPQHGYQLMKEMEGRSGGLYRGSAGSIYPALQQLADERLLASDRQQGRRVYSLTAAGRRELQRDPEAVRRIWERAERWEDWGACLGPETIAAVGPLTEILKAAMRASGRVSGKRAAEQRLRDILERTRRELEQL